MDPRRLSLIWVNLLGGISVLASYAHGFVMRTGEMGALWGGVPESLRPIYTINMFLAAAGYLIFARYVVFALPPETRLARGRLGYAALVPLYTAVLLCSALWLPLTFSMVTDPSEGLWLVIRLVLATVGGAAIAIHAVVWTADSAPSRERSLALLAFIPFVLQTAVLDGLIWPAFFPAA